MRISLYSKLVVACIIGALVFWSATFFMISLSERTLTQNMGEASVALSNIILDEVHVQRERMIDQLLLLAETARVQEMLRASNAQFASLEDVQRHLINADISWEDGDSALIAQVIENDLSIRLRDLMDKDEGAGLREVEELFITNKYGALVAASGKTTDFMQADETWWIEARDEGFFLGDFEYDESALVESLPIAVRVDDSSGNMMGVIKSVPSLDLIEAIVESIREQTGLSSIEIGLFSSSGVLIFSSDGFSSITLPFDQLLNEPSSFHLINTQEGNFIYAHSLSADLDGERLFIITRIAQEEILGGITLLKNSLVALALGLSLFALVASILVARYLTSPLFELKKAIHEMEKGNFTFRTAINTGDEFEEVGKGLNKAIEALSSVDEEHKQLDRAKTEFISITSHELRSPMTAMIAQLQMVRENYFGELNKKQRTALDIVLRNTQRLDTIISDFLELSRIEAARLTFNFQKCDLRRHIDDLIDEFKGFIPEKNISIVKKVGSLPLVECDPDRVMQVLRNFLTNAFKFSPKGSKILLNVELQGPVIKFSVMDEGIGIDPRHQVHLFEPFYQVDKSMSREQGGTGLGLAICKGIVKSQEGDIGVISKPGKGATFWFTLPLSPVKDIKPIKLMFSSRTAMEAKLFDVFKEMLGPFGEAEFQEIQREHQLTKQNLFEYVDDLEKKGVLDSYKSKYFKESLKRALEQEAVEGADSKEVEEDLKRVFDHGR